MLTVGLSLVYIVGVPVFHEQLLFLWCNSPVWLTPTVALALVGLSIRYGKVDSRRKALISDGLAAGAAALTLFFQVTNHSS